MDNGMNKKADGDAYADMLNQVKGTKEGQEALGRISPGEIGWGLAGAAGGGALGYLMSRLVHRKASARTKMLYTLLGALAGGGGSQYLLANMKGSNGFNGTKRDEMRLSGLSVMPTVNTEDVKTDSKGNPKADNSALAPFVTAAAAGTLGAVRGARLGDKRHLGSLLTGAPNVYEWAMDRRYGKREDMEKMLQRYLARHPREMGPRGLFANGKQWRRWTVTHDQTSPYSAKLVPIKHEHNYARDAANMSAAALLHGAAGYGGHMAYRWLANKHGFSDPDRAYVTKEDILKAAEQMRRKS